MYRNLRITCLVSALLGLSPVAAQAEDIAAFTVAGDAIAAPLRGLDGDVVRGAGVVRNREKGNCLICHSVSDPLERFQGNLAPTLDGVGSRLTAGQIRLRLVDPTLVNTRAIMPAYHRIAGFRHVDARYAGQPVLGAQEIEDAVAYLSSLRD